MGCVPLEWNPVLEDRLKRSKQSAGWRWIGYFLAAVGTWMLFGGFALGTMMEEAGAPFWTGFLPGGLLLTCGIGTCLPAEKAAKEARELAIQKAAASAQPLASQVVRPTCACGAVLVAGTRFCASCGKAVAA